MNPYKYCKIYTTIKIRCKFNIKYLYLLALKGLHCSTSDKIYFLNATFCPTEAQIQENSSSSGELSERSFI